VKPRSKLVLTVVILAGTSVAGLAQVPPVRPGLNLPASSSPAPSSTTPPATGFVQRDYQGQSLQGQSVGAGAYPAQSSAPPLQEEFFYVQDGAAGPDDLQSGLSDFNSGRMSQAGQQLRGDYGAVSPMGALPAGAMQKAWNRPFDNMSAGQSAPGSIRYQWSADLVMPVRLRAGMVTNIVLPEWEAAQDVLIGDGGAVEATILRPNQIAVKSVQTGLDTSLSVTGGSGNVYTFYLRTEGRNTTRVTDLQVFVQAPPSKGSGQWFNAERRGAFIVSPVQMEASVPAPTPSRAAAPGDIDMPMAARQGDEAVPVDKRNFNLKMYEVNEGDAIIAPQYAYTDGRFTYLVFPAGMTDRPAVFRVSDGVEGRVNTRVIGPHSETVIVEALGDLILRSGTRAVCIVEVDQKDQVVSRF